MTDLLNQRLQQLASPQHIALLGQGLRGVERETLRVDRHGQLAHTPHPPALGSALTNDLITTDYSESLLEFITPAEPDIATALQRLDEIHRFVYARLGGELLWNASMPCVLPPEDEIPIAWYGSSHIGMLKHVYRRGLALRYGRTMQCIAGIHYNFSLNEGVWDVLRESDRGVDASVSRRDYQSERYIALIRNFRRYSWLLMYLFGASPAVATNFLRGRPHQLETLSDDTLYLPYGTSLRMSDLGYQNNAQANITPHYNNLPAYIRSLAHAVSEPYPPYEAIGAKRDGEWVQINTNILQIENEFYSSIRPKRVIYSGERPVQALSARGVQYVEVRCMDIDPFDPLGINLQTARFLDVFLHFLAFDDSCLTSDEEGIENRANFMATVKQGRQPGLQLQFKGRAIGLKEWGEQLLERMAPVAELLDRQAGGSAHRDSMAAQRAKLADPDATPSARVLREIRAAGNSFPAWALQNSAAQAGQLLAEPLTAAQTADFVAIAQASLEAQREIERTQTGDFDAFVAAYRASTLGNISV
ncbi:MULTISPECIES: glutamate--cysteine ligase [unclassified Herbaspirillum]|uniref:glutamate--cysteine ligase n=1 Tax=unclassified Herbaspirillum TaxID=2624150 RepID=UPI0011545832|nr:MULTISPECIES: glutamate--cysteine ligase [unclassified Herbaspirillum]MBB5391830.1 glutamate--cysteine ligase [Herbaspirillum sp. SJZ102]TQK02926.1 glutamate-cysteine ligase [Herbaspirillum sp. SJZ130]TQK06686.1 glutamate-cysteine ligase [Herbaspirillum sp. SJZ106]